MCSKVWSTKPIEYPESVSLIAPDFMKIGVESNITCQVLDVAPIRYLSVKLYKGDEQLGNRSFTHNSTRFPVNESVPFPVTPTRADNGAEYTCVAELQLELGEPIKNSSLPFRMLPIGASSAVCDVNIDPSRVVVRFGDPVTLSCSTIREDVLAAGWESSVSPVNERDSKIAVWNVSSLTVWDAEPKCFINYMKEPRQCVEKLDLVIYNKPSLLSAAEENVEVREGGSIVLKCSADGSPAPTYEWKYPKADNVQEITKDGVSTVNITRASSSNARVYECHAKNTYGVATKNITLTVKGGTPWILIILLIIGVVLAIAIIVGGIKFCRR
ncbi:UNVERIFIED_CONTAM: hypothetical protein FKN15_001933 [Acipenser sinensis]